MAHTRSILAKCSQPGCEKQAAVEVYTIRNEPMGKYCALHGERRAKQLRDQEQ